MYSDPFIPIFVSTLSLILLIGIVLRKLKQSHVVAYLITGFLLGPYMFGYIQDQEAITRLGSFGVILLLFFIGMEISPRRLAENWLISVVGTLLQVIVSIGLVSILGFYYDWPIERIVLVGFVISLSSTALILKLLEDWNEMNTRVGQDVLGILLIQDIIVVPMLICLNFLGGSKPSMQQITLQVIGGIIIVSIVSWIIRREKIHLSWLNPIKEDHELQVFAALGICFGMALFTGLMGLSAPLGAFIGGIIVGSANETQWIQQKLLPIRTIFIALFFVSVGTQIDVGLIIEKSGIIAFLVLAVFLSNTAINATILKLLGESWKVSLYGGSILSQIGEFSFLISSFGYYAGIIYFSTYELTILVITLTLLLSPLWILLIRNIMNITERMLKKEPRLKT